MKARPIALSRKMETNLLLLTFLMFCGCAHYAISENLREKAVSLGLQEVSQNPEAYRGKIVIWGGEIMRTVSREDRTTLMEVLQKTLDSRGEPESGEEIPGGRFMVLTDKYLDPYIYKPGRKVTVAGEIVEVRTESKDAGSDRIPVLSAKEINLWSIFGAYSFYGERPPWYDPNYHSPWGPTGRPYRY